MKPNTKAFCLLIGIGVLAFGLAALVHQRNEAELTATEASQITQQSSSSSSPSSLPAGTSTDATASATSTQLTATSTAATTTVRSVPPTFFSSDKINQAALDGFPRLASPFHAYGTGTAFESTLSWRVRDAQRHLLGQGSIAVRQPDAGIPGPFDFTGRLDTTPSTTSGTLLIFEFSAKDGTPIHIVTIPVVFATSTAL